MSQDAHGVTIQSCRHCGTGAPSDAHFCPKCDKILSFVRHGDYFAFLGLPRRLHVEPKNLDQRLRSLSRQFHPDYYCNATPAERLASLERASYLNDAYRTLREPATRVEYLLQIEGLPLRKRSDSTGGVPPALLEHVFELNEELDAIREARAAGAPADDLRARLDAARRPIEARVAAHQRRFDDAMAQWDALVDRDAPAQERRQVLETLKQLLLEKSYLDNLLAAVQKETGSESPKP
jgi:molecular chaperone HscB